VASFSLPLPSPFSFGQTPGHVRAGSDQDQVRSRYLLYVAAQGGTHNPERSLNPPPPARTWGKVDAGRRIIRALVEPKDWFWGLSWAPRTKSARCTRLCTHKYSILSLERQRREILAGPCWGVVLRDWKGVAGWSQKILAQGRGFRVLANRQSSEGQREQDACYWLAPSCVLHRSSTR
jgi:hypothetical protein